MKLSTKLQLAALLFTVSTGCTHIPPDVAAELSAPDGKRPNNYATTAVQNETESTPELAAP